MRQKKGFSTFWQLESQEHCVKRRFLKSSIAGRQNNKPSKRSVLFFTLCEKDGLEWTLSHLSFSISPNLASTTFSLSYCIKQRETGKKERNCSLHSNTAKRINITKTYGKLIIEMFTFGRAYNEFAHSSPFLSNMSRMKKAIHLQNQIPMMKVNLFLKFNSKSNNLKY